MNRSDFELYPDDKTTDLDQIVDDIYRLTGSSDRAHENDVRDLVRQVVSASQMDTHLVNSILDMGAENAEAPH